MAALLPGYRGLDTNLWAALEGHPDDMAVTLHAIDVDIDAGPVYELRRLGAPPDLDLHTLRYHTTLLCTELFELVLGKFAGGAVQCERQTGAGRYFGPMPPLMKRRAGRALRAYAATGPVS